MKEKYKTDKKEPEVLTRMRLSCCWGDNLNDKELSEVVDYINFLQREVEDLKEKVILLKAGEPMLEFAKQTYKANWNELKKWLDKLNEDVDLLNEDILVPVSMVKLKMEELER